MKLINRLWFILGIIWIGLFLFNLSVVTSVERLQTFREWAATVSLVIGSVLLGYAFENEERGDA